MDQLAHFPQGVARDDLGQHQFVGLVLLSVSATGQPVPLFLLLYPVVGVVLLPLPLTAAVVLEGAEADLVTVQTHHKATLVTHPVHVEQRRITDVTHLAHPGHCSLPRNFG